MGRHANLVIAHDNPEQLHSLLRCLDYPENDIFLHLDASSGDPNNWGLHFEPEYSKLFVLTNRVKVTWGNYSQIECELRLLERAIEGSYEWYHLMSGADLPLRSQKAIHDFYDAHKGKEFIHFDSRVLDAKTYARVSKYAFFAERNKNLLEKALYRITTALQFPIDRGKRYGVKYQKGANWFCITDSLARYVVEMRPWIERVFKRTRCGDEFFLQTLVINSKYKDSLFSNAFDDDYSSIMYCIDWNRGNPWVFKSADYDLLMNSGMLFARKFDSRLDGQIIDRIVSSVAFDV